MKVGEVALSETVLSRSGAREVGNGGFDSGEDLQGILANRDDVGLRDLRGSCGGSGEVKVLKKELVELGKSIDFRDVRRGGASATHKARDARENAERRARDSKVDVN